jgi:hypothetical protein
MNRIVLIGNGFDLAHGLKTSYADFINWYWEQWKERLLKSKAQIEKDELCSFKIDSAFHNNRLGALINNYYPTWCNLSAQEFIKNISTNLLEIEVHIPPLLNRINDSIIDKKWVDIERVYYTLLCDTLKENSKINVDDLNNQLQALTNKLCEYLKNVEENSDREINKAVKEKIYEPIKLQDIAVEAEETVKQYFKDRCAKIHILNLLEKYQKIGILKNYDLEMLRISYKDDFGHYMQRDYKFATLPEKILLVNFNYTNIADQYVPEDQEIASVNHIHGTLEEPESMIFGYGDEIDKRYMELSDLEDNRYMKNIKSHRYLERNKYRELLQFANSDEFQIYIMGHACGNSDRTLLNTLFEHDNCVSIKPFFYQYGSNDNYNDIIQNISRHFPNRQKFRDRVVNKTYCEPLPQASAN